MSGPEDIFIAKFKISITDITTDQVWTYYENYMKWSDFLEFLEKVKNERGLENDHMSIEIEVIDKAVAFFD